ncbi:MAG: iron-containing alcohol dehydrogenase [Aliishimia sp.]
MTLITYPTRVHFADGVLQEALHSELEHAACKAPLLIHDDMLHDSELSDRILEGLPHAMNPTSLTFDARSDLREVISSHMRYADLPDVIIAFGSARAIELSRKCRYALREKTGQRALLYAVPGVDGMPGPCTRNLESWRSGLPSVLICDPTVTLNAAPAQSWRSAVLSLVRCVESYLADTYNPPADGMALDGLGRCVVNLPRIDEDHGLSLHREVMAACLNAAWSQEKGVGPALTLVAALIADHNHLNEAELARLILPEMIRRAKVHGEKSDMLLKVFGEPASTLDAAVAHVLDPLPMPTNLSELGLRPDDLDRAADTAAGKAGLDFANARTVLETIF